MTRHADHSPTTPFLPIDEATRQAQFDLFAAAGGFGAWELDPIAGQYHFDGRSLAILGLGDATPHRYDVSLAIHPDQREAFTRVITDAIRDSGTIDQVVRLATDEDEQKWIRWRALPVADDTGGMRLVGLIQDVTTERRLLEDSLLREQRLQLALEAGQLTMWEWDPATKTGTVDGGLASRRDGSQKFLQDAVDAFLHPDHVEANHRIRVDAAATHGPVEASLRIDDPDSGTRWVRTAALGFDDPLTGRRRVIGVNKDITAEYAAQVELEERSNRLELALSATRTTIDEYDIAAGRSLMSDRWYESLGYEASEFRQPGFGPENLIHPDDWPELERKRRLHADGEGEMFEDVFRVRRSDGTWGWNHLRARVVDWDEHGHPTRMIAANTDVTDRRRLEQRLLHSTTMQALASFSAGIAHDFNNIMAIVQGHTEALLTRDLDHAERSRRLGIIQQSVDRAKSLVRDLMHLNRPDPAGDRTVDLCESVRQVASSLPFLLGEDIELSLDLTSEPTPIRIDPARLEAIVLNAAANSRDAMPTGGKLTLSVGLDTETDPDAGTDTAVVTFDITDTGTGMSAETLASIFDPFFSTKAPGVGTGLGLATSFDTVHLAGGTITAASTIGEGTTLRLRFPAADAPSSADRGTPMPAAAGPGADTILVVEDDADILELTAEALRSAGYRVHEALGGHEALEILEDHAVDLVVTDAVMPMMNGAQLAEAIRSRWPAVRILFQTGYAADTTAIASIDPLQVLMKPATETELVHRVAEMLHGPPL